MRQHSSRLSFATVSLYTAAGLLLLMVCLGQVSTLRKLDTRIWILLFVSSVLGICSAHLLYYRGIQGLGPIIAASTLKATPLLTLIGAMIFLGEKMSVDQFIGGLIIILGAILLLKCKSRMESARSLSGAK